MAKGTATIDFGATPINYKEFTITDPTMAGLTYVEPFFMSSDSTVDNSASNHAKARWVIEAIGGAPVGNDFPVICRLKKGLCTGTFKIRYAGS